MAQRTNEQITRELEQARASIDELKHLKRRLKAELGATAETLREKLPTELHASLIGRLWLYRIKWDSDSESSVTVDWQCAIGLGTDPMRNFMASQTPGCGDDEWSTKGFKQVDSSRVGNWDDAWKRALEINGGDEAATLACMSLEAGDSLSLRNFREINFPASDKAKQDKAIREKET